MVCQKGCGLGGLGGLNRFDRIWAEKRPRMIVELAHKRGNVSIAATGRAVALQSAAESILVDPAGHLFEPFFASGSRAPARCALGTGLIQTFESIEMHRQAGRTFGCALNKSDRCITGFERASHNQWAPVKHVQLGP